MTPKRKRTSAGTTSLPQIDTIIADAALDSEPESPRSRVAANLCHLQIHDQRAVSENLPPAPSSHSQLHTVENLPASDGGAPDIHLRPVEANTHLELDALRALVTPPKEKPTRATMDTTEGAMEICETPGAYNVSSFSQRLPSSPPTSPSPSPLDLDQLSPAEDTIPGADHTNNRGRGAQQRRNSNYRGMSRTSAGRLTKSESSDMEVSSEVQSSTFTLQPPKPVAARRKKKCAPTPVTAPPPPTPLTSPGEGPTTEPLLATATARMLSIPTIPLESQNSYPENMEEETSLSPRPSKKKRRSPSPPASNPSLTWQDSEITGHLWDPSMDLDDDGEGINGIGFRPTAAIEWKRKEGRKRQVTEWRAREAKEDRRRRFEKRKMGGGSSSSSGGARHVSFAPLDQGGPVHEAEDDQGQEGKRVRVRFAEVA